MIDVLIVGAGPAGSVAGAVLARNGVRVRIIDRAAFPRDKLCGDTVNPGTLALLRRLDMSTRLEGRGLPVEGMIVSGPDGTAVTSPYAGGVQGRAMLRRELDWSLLQRAIAAGAAFEPRTVARRAVVVDGAGAAASDRHLARSSESIGGVELQGGHVVRARVVIAADGRHSTLAFGLGIARHPVRPRRWAIGAYFENARTASDSPVYGEMHVRRNGYIGVARVPGGLTNVCVVKSWGPAADGAGAALGEGALRDPEGFLFRELARDSMLRDRLAGARLVTPPVVLGPLAVDVDDSSMDGLLLAGDAAGFIDPMTGDGLRFAVQGGTLAAQAALQALNHGWPGVHAALLRARRREFAAKWRFNRTLRALVDVPAAVRVGEIAATMAPFALRAVVRRAGDCDLGNRPSPRPDWIHA